MINQENHNHYDINEALKVENLYRLVKKKKMTLGYKE